MGGFLSQPKTGKETHAGEGAGVKFALSSMQGWRVEMEDAHIATADIGHLENHAYFAVFDGHGGKTVSTRAGEEFIKFLVDTELMKDQKALSAEELKDLLYQTNFDFDDYLRATDSELASGEDRSGSTAVACMLTPTHYIFSNCGDSRAILGSNGSVTFATVDHKPSDPEETARIEKAKGTVSMGRVNGNLAVSRALGDFIFKDTPKLPAKAQKVCCEPDMTIIERSENDEFIVLACDGIWDVMSNQEVYEFVKNQLKAGYELTEICNRVINYCLAKDSRDNMSVVIVLLPSAPTAEEGFTAPEVVPEYPEEDEEEGASKGPKAEANPLAGTEAGENPMALMDLLSRLGLQVQVADDDDGTGPKAKLITSDEHDHDHDHDHDEDEDENGNADAADDAGDDSASTEDGSSTEGIADDSASNDDKNDA